MSNHHVHDPIISSFNRQQVWAQDGPRRPSSGGPQRNSAPYRPPRPSGGGGGGGGYNRNRFDNRRGDQRRENLVPMNEGIR